jgi:hypothetical protein
MIRHAGVVLLVCVWAATAAAQSPPKRAPVAKRLSCVEIQKRIADASSDRPSSSDLARYREMANTNGCATQLDPAFQKRFKPVEALDMPSATDRRDAWAGAVPESPADGGEATSPGSD